MGKRLFDVLLSILGLLVLSPLLTLIALLVWLSSRGGAFYVQRRVGRWGREFGILKFRTMHLGSDRQGLLTVGGHDARVTRVGYYLRRYKLDELPQLVNVLLGDMSLVGPRPEVSKYVSLYTPEQREVLRIRPGITDLASIMYRHENELLAQAADPERFYIEEVMPAKLELNLKYLQNQSFGMDMMVLFRTLACLRG